MSGSPLRPDRSSFGEVFVDSTAVRDPRKQMAARIMNLVTWQVSGAGLLMPRAALAFTMGVSPVILGRVEAWNPNRESTGVFADPTITRTGAGNYLVEYPTEAPDENGENQPISFSWAGSFVINADPTVAKHTLAAVDAQTNRLRVTAFSAAHALEDGNDVLLLGW